MTLPSGLITLAFGDGFNQSLDAQLCQLDCRAWLSAFALTRVWRFQVSKVSKDLRRLILGFDFDQNPDGLKLPSLRSLTLGKSDSFGSKKLEQMTFPSGLQSLVLGPFGNLR